MQIDNDGKHIGHIIDTTDCNKHVAPSGTPCYGVYFDSSHGFGRGVCGSRIRAAGFVGQISASSTQQKAASGRARNRF